MRHRIWLASLLLGLVLPGSAAFAQELVFCSREHQYCRVPYPTQVIYGIPGRSRTLEVRGPGVTCSNEMFGDPAPGVPKTCHYVSRRSDDRRGPDRGRPGWDGPGRDRPGWDRPGRDGPGWDGPGRDRRRGPEWQTCAPEGGACRWQGTKRVRYGVPGGRFVERSYRNGVMCNNSIFGDPAPGRPKICQVLD